MYESELCCGILPGNINILGGNVNIYQFSAQNTKENWLSFENECSKETQQSVSVFALKK